MIVKENLLSGYDGTHLLEARNEGKPSDNFNFLQIILPNNLEEGKNYTISFEARQHYGSGKFTIMPSDISSYATTGKVNMEVKDKRIYVEFVYRIGLSQRLLIYADIAGETRGVEATFSNFHLFKGHLGEEAKSVVYIPNEKDVKPENQAIFPIGGGYQDIYPL